jgi:hypothetical protein
MILTARRAVTAFAALAVPASLVFAGPAATASPGEAGSIFVAVTPCDAGNAPPACPAPGFPPNYLGTLGPWTGHVSKVALSGPRLEPQGLMFLPANH